MSLQSALVDKARVLRKVTRKDPDTQQPIKVAGGKITDEVPGPWFRAFYDPAMETESRDQGTVRRERSAGLIAGKRDMEGNALELQADDRIEINSRRHGQLILEIEGAPEILATKFAKLGQRVSLRRVVRS